MEFSLVGVPEETKRSVTPAESNSEPDVRNIIIIGSGPAGLAASLYASRAHLDPLLLTGDDIGGQVSLTSEVENYPGFPDSITGPELVQKMQEQAEKFGTVVHIDTVTAVNLESYPFKLSTYERDYKARALIIATGASHRKLNVPGEERLIGRGVSYCATCDGWFFNGKEIVVVGGGDSALEEGIFLTRFASKVTIIHRRDELRAGKTLQKRAFNNDKIDFIWNTVVEEIVGDEKVNGVRLHNRVTGEDSFFPTEGVFVFIGHTPNSQLFEGQLEVDDHGYLVVDRHYMTSKEGVWAAGEVADSTFRQVITSAGMGASAAIMVERWLGEKEEIGA